MEIIATTKITNRDGIKAVKNGQKLNKYFEIPTPKKPSWLKVKAEFNPNFHKVKLKASNYIQFAKKLIAQILMNVGLLEPQLLC